MTQGEFICIFIAFALCLQILCSVMPMSYSDTFWCRLIFILYKSLKQFGNNYITLYFQVKCFSFQQHRIWCRKIQSREVLSFKIMGSIGSLISIGQSLHKTGSDKLSQTILLLGNSDYRLRDCLGGT